ncbi:MAG TPA: glycine--tRNA ligase subunit beta [Nitrospirales bacterium]|nr:glycine--tRNA ligase subunit beta [Nitrospirales bacterium]
MTRPKTTGHELLLEIGTEELPSHFVAPALVELEERAARLLKAARLGHGAIKTVGTPRRLTLVVAGLANHQEPVATTVMGPSKAVGFDPEGRPTKAAIGFAAAQGVRVEDLEIRATPKGDYVFAVKREAGRKTAALLPDLLSELVGSLPFPKAMRWNDSGARFARPVRWLLALYGGKPVRFQFAGLTAGDKTFGHRFISSNKRLRIVDFKSYMNGLEKAGVIVDPERRRAMIASQVERIAKQKRGHLHRDPSLVEQAVFSVEMPEAIAGAFNPTYLALPKDVLVTAMKEHQGYFSLLARDGRLLPFFVAVANMGGRHVQTIRTGNERVLAARLADAKFFFNEDRKTLLKDRVERLKGVTFHQKVGTLYQKVGRITALASKLADTISEGDLDTVEQCRRAATLCKADLVTGMVGEFPTLQGLMGREYALHDGERQEVADAIAEHYLPRFADDAIPPSLAGRVLSLADRLDTLASFFAVGLVPSGSQDPFALRRHAYAVIRILVEGGLSLDLIWAIEYAEGLLKDQGIAVEQKAQAELLRFFGERLRYYCMDGDKLRGDLVDAVLAQRQTGTFDPRDVRARAQALQAFSARAEFESLVVAFKRAENITKGRQDDSVEPALFQEPVEKELHASLMAAEATFPGFIERADYENALAALVVLKPPIDAFFLGVMVMAEDESVRQNRLALLVRVRNLFRLYADFSKVQVEAS